MSDNILICITALELRISIDESDGANSRRLRNPYQSNISRLDRGT
jgi:hypothetical protein